VQGVAKAHGSPNAKVVKVASIAQSSPACSNKGAGRPKHDRAKKSILALKNFRSATETEPYWQQWKTRKTTMLVVKADIAQLIKEKDTEAANEIQAATSADEIEAASKLAEMVGLSDLVVANKMLHVSVSVLSAYGSHGGYSVEANGCARRG
jgi:hypothetical protein